MKGATWTALSGDLTTNDKKRQKSSGGLITQDNTSVEYYCTIFTATESWVEKDVLWTGSDDGVISLSRDGGGHWETVTPKDCPPWMMWNCVEVDPFKKGGAYFVGTRYKSDDFTPYIYKTEDYGKTWKLITSGIDKMHFTRCLRADHKRPGLLYAGTEYGMYISYDDGMHWKPFQLNLPIVSITDLTVKDNDLIVATQGRAFWVLDDLTVLQESDGNIPALQLHVFHINPAYRMRSLPFRSFGNTPANAGANPPVGAVINYFVKEVTDSVNASITILDKDRKLIHTYSTRAKEMENKLAVSKGMNRFAWNMQYPGADRAEGMILWNGTPGAIVTAPGRHYARIRVENDSTELGFEIKADPNYPVSQADYDAQLSFLLTIRDKFNEVQKAIKNIRAIRTQINDYTARWDTTAPRELKQMADSISRQLTAIEETLYQTKAKSGQDVLNYPIRLNDKLSGVFDVANSGNMAPSRQAKEVYADLAAQADVQLKKLETIMTGILPRFNRLIREKELPVIGIKNE